VAARSQPLIALPSIVASFAGGILLIGLAAAGLDAVADAALAVHRAAGAQAEWGMSAGWFRGDGSATASNRLDWRGVSTAMLAGPGLLVFGLYGLRACAISWRCLLSPGR
jgi:hypothetical protein